MAMIAALLCPGRPAWLLWPVLAIGIAINGLPTAAAHDLFTAYIQHRVHLRVGAEHVDLTLDLTFFEEWSARERQRMDLNGDKRITRAELRTYLQTLGPELGKQLRLRAGPRALALTPLFEPEADLLGSDKTGPAHHRLKMFFFAPTPPDLRAADIFTIETSLWAEAKGLVAIQAEGRDGCMLEPEKLADAGLAPAPRGQARTFQVKCIQPPQGLKPKSPSAPSG